MASKLTKMLPFKNRWIKEKYDFSSNLVSISAFFQKTWVQVKNIRNFWEIDNLDLKLFFKVSKGMGGVTK